MYDSLVFCEEYKELKDIIAAIINSEDETTDIEELREHIQKLYEDGKMQATQYDDLIGYLEDFGL